MPKMKGGELIAEFLVNEKIPYVFGICGHGNVGLLDPLYQVRDKIEYVSPRHEQVAGGHPRQLTCRGYRHESQRSRAWVWEYRSLRGSA